MTLSCSCIGCEIIKVKDLIRNAIWTTGAQGLVVGVSGGIDSAVSCALAVKAVSAERVLGVSMPISHSRNEDENDAKELCAFLGVELITVPLGAVHQTFLATEHISSASPILSGNIAARLRMITLYNIAAERNYLVCGTSNKTEYMIGYSTKWGDSAADIQPLLHLYKREIYEIAEDLEIPESIMKKAPSAGFYDGQTDEADIGLTYDELDTALFNLELNDFVPKNKIEEKVLSLVEKSEHKRRLPISKFSLQQKIE